MGCDIHFYVERRVDGAWRSVDVLEDDGYGGQGVRYDKRFYAVRSYSLFSVLADVRNGYGFAGVKTGSGYVPIHAPRGVPSDADALYLRMVDDADGDGHSHSWATLAELLAYDWTQVTTRCGWVGIYDWALWRDRGKPEEWSSGVGGGATAHVGAADFEAAWQTVRRARGLPEQRKPSYAMRRVARLGQAETDPIALAVMAALGGAHISYYCEVEWREPYHDAVADGWWTRTIPRMLALGRPEDVRCLYFFDN